MEQGRIAKLSISYCHFLLPIRESEMVLDILTRGECVNSDFSPDNVNISLSVFNAERVNQIRAEQKEKAKKYQEEAEIEKRVQERLRQQGVETGC